MIDREYICDLLETPEPPRKIAKGIRSFDTITCLCWFEVNAGRDQDKVFLSEMAN